MNRPPGFIYSAIVICAPLLVVSYYSGELSVRKASVILIACCGALGCGVLHRNVFRGIRETTHRKK